MNLQEFLRLFDKWRPINLMHWSILTEVWNTANLWSNTQILRWTVRNIIHYRGRKEKHRTIHSFWLTDDFHFFFFYSCITTAQSEVEFHPLCMTWSSYSLHISLAINKMQNAGKKKPTGHWLIFLAHSYLYVTGEQSIPDIIPAESLKLGHGWVFTHYYWGGR